MTAAGVTTLPLYTIPTDLAASFQLKIPGSSELWECTAETTDHSLRIVATFILGCDRHHALRPYCRNNQLYRRRPNLIAPPVPAFWPCVHLKLFQAGQLIASLFDDTAPQALTSPDRLDVTIGASQLWAESGGAVHLHAAPRSTLAATLTELHWLPLDSSSRWAADLAHPHHYRWATPFRVTGLLRGFHSTVGNLPAQFAFDGQGQLQHRVILYPNAPSSAAGTSR